MLLAREGIRPGLNVIVIVVCYGDRLVLLAHSFARFHAPGYC